MLVVKNSKNPASEAKSLTKHSKVSEETGSCCNHSKNPVGRYNGICKFCDEASQVSEELPVVYQLCAVHFLVPLWVLLPLPGPHTRIKFLAPNEVCRPGGNARGLMMAALPKQAPLAAGNM